MGTGDRHPDTGEGAETAQVCVQNGGDGRSTPSIVDVAIVGAGFAGLNAAACLAAAGRSIVVLEARDRVGGRIAPATLAGLTVDAGGMWTSTRQHRVTNLIAEHRLVEYPTWLTGRGVSFLQDQRAEFRLDKAEESLPIRTVAEYLRLAERLEAMGATIDPAEPWAAEGAAAWDALSVDAWVRGMSNDPACHAAWDFAVRTIVCGRSADVSLLYFLFYVRSGGGLAEQASAQPGGAQSNLVAGGLHQLAARMAAPLKSAIRLGEPVTAIRQDGGQALIVGAAGTYRARRVIVAVPPGLARRITWDPAPLAGWWTMTEQMPSGSVIKVWIAYATPFWRDRGLNGVVFSAAHGFRLAFDVTPPGTAMGVIAGFFDADSARHWGRRPAFERKAEVIRCLADALGAEARNPLDVVETDWTVEPWSEGCFGAYAVPGAFARFGRFLRQPWGLVHWAGTETAESWNGYVEGALQSGERAAREALDCLDG